jgi:dsRNA-specific ribonuclease
MLVMTQANKDKIHNLEENIRFVERQFNYTFKNKSLIKQAFYNGVQHTQYKGKHYGINNQGLEYIGDRVLYVAIAMNTLSMSPHKLSSDGFYIGPTCAEFHKKGISQTKNSHLCVMMNSKYLKFLKKLVIAPKIPDSNESKMWADLYESIFGAIALDCNFDMNTILRSYLASKTIVQHKGMLNYIESKKESDRKAKFRNLI